MPESKTILPPTDADFVWLHHILTLNGCRLLDYTTVLIYLLIVYC